MINKTVKEVLRLLKRDGIISQGEYLRMWKDYKHTYKVSSLQNGLCALRWSCKNLNKRVCNPLPESNEKYVECKSYVR